MPTVPSYDLPTVEMSAGQMPALQAPGTQPMADVAGKQLGENAQILMKSGLAIKKLADDINFDLAEAGAKQDTNRLSDEIRNVVVEYGKLTGKEAVDNREKFVKQIEDKITAINDENSNSDQPKGYAALRQQLFANAANTRRQVAMGQIDSHFLPQLKNWQIGEAKSAIHNSINDTAAAASDWQNPNGAYAKFKGTLIVNVGDLVYKSGITKINEKGEKVVDTDSAQYKELLRTSLSELHTNVVKNFDAQGRDGMAAAYLKANKSEISADKLDELTKLIGESSTASQSLNITRKLNGTLSENLAALDKMYEDGKINQKVYDASVARVEHNWSRQQTQKAQWEKGLIGSAQAWLDQNKDKSAEDLPSDMKMNLQNSGHWSTIKSYSKNGRFETDPKTWGQILGMPTATLAEMTPDQFYTKYRAKLDDDDMNKGLALVGAARNGGKGDKNHTEVRTIQEEIQMVAKENKIIPWSGSKSETHQKDFAMFETEVSQRIRAWELENPGKKVSSAEVKSIANRVVSDKVTLDINWGFDKEVPSYKVKPGDKPYVMISGNKRINLSDIPDAEYTNITNDIKARNKRRMAEGKPLIPITQQIIAAEWDSRNTNK